MPIRKAYLLLAVMMTLAGARVARAQAPNDTDRAKALFQDAMRHYNVGEFALAAAKFIDAYKAAPDPTFLYNAAQAYRLGGEHQKALFFYKSYLRDAPDAANRAEVEKRIEQLKEIQEPPSEAKNPDPRTTEPKVTEPKVAEPKVTEPKVTEPKVTEPAVGKLDTTVPDSAVDHGTGPTDSGGGSRPVYKKWWFWTVVGAVAIGGTVAVVVMTSGDGGVSTELGDIGPGSRASALGVSF